MKTNVPEPFQPEDGQLPVAVEGLPAGLSDAKVNYRVFINCLIGIVKQGFKAFYRLRYTVLQTLKPPTGSDTTAG